MGGKKGAGRRGLGRERRRERGGGEGEGEEDEEGEHKKELPPPHTQFPKQVGEREIYR